MFYKIFMTKSIFHLFPLKASSVVLGTRPICCCIPFSEYSVGMYRHSKHFLTEFHKRLELVDYKVICNKTLSYRSEESE